MADTTTPPPALDLDAIDALIVRVVAGIDAYASANDEYAVVNNHAPAWREADDMRRLLATLPRLTTALRAAQRERFVVDEAAIERAGEAIADESGFSAVYAEKLARIAITAARGGG